MELIVYPNPTDGLISINNNPNEVEIKTLIGETIETFTGSSFNNSSYSAVIYLFEIRTANTKKIIRIVKK